MNHQHGDDKGGGGKTILYVVIGLAALFIAAIGCVFALSLFGGVASYSLMRQGTAAQEEQTRLKLSQVGNAIELYQVSSNELPANLDALTSGDKPVLSSPADLDDAWGQRFEYEPSAGHYTLYSRGRDGVAGTADDIHR